MRRKREREDRHKRNEREGGRKRERITASDEAENLVTVFRGRPKALSGGVEANSRGGLGGRQEQSCGRRESKGRLKKFIERST